MGTGTPVTTGQKIEAAKMNLKLETIGDIGELPNRFTRPVRCFASDGITKKHLIGPWAIFQETPANGDIIQSFLIGDLTETYLYFSMVKGPEEAIFDLYFNEILIQAGIDNYSASSVTVERRYDISAHGKAGKNIVEFRVNGKNAASTDYFITTYNCYFS